MMSRNQFDELLKALRAIEEKLEVLINIQRMIMPKPTIGKEEKRILELCDRKHTIDDIVKETGKTENNIKVMLSHLRNKVVIRSVEIKGRLVYERI